MLCLGAQFVLPDPAFPVDRLLTGNALDDVDTLVNKKFKAISEDDLKENLKHPSHVPNHPWGTTELTSVRLLACLARMLQMMRLLSECITLRSSD